jgi:2-polyprenyl-6-methoxyphenol hydroxylase-like FAD-dependent oxidoreductase
MSSGRSLSRLAFYEGNSRKVELNFTDLPVQFPFVLVLSQSALEGLLEEELANQGVQVAWNHRLSDVRREPDTVVATIDKLVEPVKGYVLRMASGQCKTGTKNISRF